MTIKILIVDDSLPMRGVIKKTIKASGYASAEFFEAENGKIALDILKNIWLDIVILLRTPATVLGLRGR